MIRKSFQLDTEIVASDDGTKTYEIRRSWGTGGRRGIVLELYPTLSADRCGELDLSTMHLLNHVKDFNWSEVRIINLYSTVFDTKPLASMLSEDRDNIAYIEDVLSDENIGDYDIVIATGSSLSTHKITVEAKLDILHILQDKKLDSQVKCIVPEYLEEGLAQGTHPLYLGLHHAKETWTLESYSIPVAIAELEDYLRERETNKVAVIPNEKKGGKKQKKEKTKDVLENSESTGCEVLEEGAKAV